MQMRPTPVTSFRPFPYKDIPQNNNTRPSGKDIRLTLNILFVLFYFGTKP